MFGYELAVIVLMLFFNAVFAAYEMGLASISRARLAVLHNEKKRGAADALFMKERMEASLAIVQLGVTVVGAVAAATGGAGVQDEFAPYLHRAFGVSEASAEVLAIVLLIIPLTFVTVVFAELVPKMIALKNNEAVVLKLSPFMKVLSWIAYPIVAVIEATLRKVVNLLTRSGQAGISSHKQWVHELTAAVSLARTSKLLGEREEKIVLAAAHLSTRPVHDIFIPAQDISMIYVGSSLMDALVKAHLDMHTRFPVCSVENEPQSIQGYVNFKDIVAALKINPSDPTVRGITRPIQKVKEDTVLSALLEMMIQQKTHIVIVVSQGGTVVGMATLEDVIEELVGEIEDEFDRLPTHIHPCGAAWIMGGGVPMSAVALTVGLQWQTTGGAGRIPTLAEWCAQHAGPTLKGGEAIEADDLHVLPRKFRRKRVLEATVSVRR
jgi:putative hemolysin